MSIADVSSAPSPPPSDIAQPPVVGGRPEDMLKAAVMTVNPGNYGQIGGKEDNWEVLAGTADGISLSRRQALAQGPSPGSLKTLTAVTCGEQPRKMT